MIDVSLMTICLKMKCPHFKVEYIPSIDLNAGSQVTYYCSQCGVGIDSATTHWLIYTVDAFEFDPLIKKCKYKAYVKKVDKVSKL